MRKFLVLLLLMGCSQARPGSPPEIDYGRHECARCGMIVSDERFAAGYVGDDGGSIAYDDLGELLTEVESRPELRSRAWARDLNGGGWLRLAEAHVVLVPGLATPMGSGWAAFSTREAAQAFLESRSGRKS